MHEKIYQIVVEQNEITWKSIIFDLINKEQMDPWNVDISLLTQKYIERLRHLKQTDLKLSGKVLLAAAILLKIKSKRLVGEDLNEFDRLLAQSEMTEDQFYDELEGELRHAHEIPSQEMLTLIPRTPQPRKRKVSVYDLVRALEKALEVKHRRLLKISSPEAQLIVPHKTIDITLAIKTIYKKIKEWFLGNRGKKLLFTELLPDTEKQTKIRTILPLLHLATQRMVDLEQKEQFGEINIKIAAKQPESLKQ